MTRLCAPAGPILISLRYKKLSNCGRWGKDDQIGTLNHVTPEDIVKAASLIRTGNVGSRGSPSRTANVSVMPHSSNTQPLASLSSSARFSAGGQ